MAGRILIYTFKSASGKDVLMVIIGAQVAIVNVFLLVKQILQTQPEDGGQKESIGETTDNNRLSCSEISKKRA
jgi:hypothetical protein